MSGGHACHRCRCLKWHTKTWSWHKPSGDREGSGLKYMPDCYMLYCRLQIVLPLLTFTKRQVEICFKSSARPAVSSLRMAATGSTASAPSNIRLSSYQKPSKQRHHEGMIVTAGDTFIRNNTPGLGWAEAIPMRRPLERNKSKPVLGCSQHKQWQS